MKVIYKTTSEHGLTPGGKLPPEKLLVWLNEKIVAASERIETAGQNGSSDDRAEGERDACRALKRELFGNLYDT